MVSNKLLLLILRRSLSPSYIFCALILIVSSTTRASAQEQNHWVYKDGSNGTDRGWLDWPQNDVDGRYCLFSGYSSHADNEVDCYSAPTNQWERVYNRGRPCPPPMGAICMPLPGIT